jgi:hypothetical protein
MTNLPITHMTLYKHGVGFFERRSTLSGAQVELSFRVEEMNDILKSLTVIDWGAGQVLGVDYATPQSREERLAGCSIRLGDRRSLRDLLVGLRGRRVRLLLEQDETATGTLMGLDEVAERQPMATSPVSLLLDEMDQVQVVTLGRVQGVEILDQRGASDLRFFLQTALSQEDYRQVTIRLTPGEHDLSVSYIAPAPTWRVSYRLVSDPLAGGDSRALLLGWGIFDNRLEEDLQGISLSLVAGMPISFVYDLYTPFTPERPVVKEEKRVAAAPVEFEDTFAAALEAEAPGAGLRSMGLQMAKAAAPAPQAMRRGVSREALEKAAPVTTTGEALGELFQYVIGTPVTVGRGQSAMVPIVSANLDYRKDLLYNGAKMPVHPIATLRLKNETGLTLERGPVTVLESGEYVGEAVLPFTVTGGEIVVPYAVELSLKVREQSGSSKEIHGMRVRGVYLHIEEWDVRWREYQFNNSTGQAMTVLTEHPRTAHYDLFDTPAPQEQTGAHWRFAVDVPGRGETKLRVQERRRVSRREKLEQQSYKGLQNYLSQGLIERKTHDRIVELLKLWENIAQNERQIGRLDKEREKIYKAQQQIQGNMGALSQQGKEGALRSRYVTQLEASEEELKALARREADLKKENEQLKARIEKQVQALE